MSLKRLLVDACTVRLLVVITASVARSADLSAQEPAQQAELPGVHVAEQCGPAPFPPQLPPLDSVLDTASLGIALRSTGINKRVVVALRLGALETGPRVRVIQSKASEDVASRTAAAVNGALRSVPLDRVWAFRLQIDVGKDLSFSLERARLCGAVPPSRMTMTRSAIVTAEEMERIRREAEETATRLRSMRHRVLVDAQGRVLAVELTVSSGDPVMDRNHTDGFKRARFKPTKLDDMPVAAWVEVRGDRFLRRQ